jgi:hypothetical protein
MHLRYELLTAVLAVATLAGGTAGAPPACAQGNTAITFIDSGQRLGLGVTFEPTLGDLDGDGDPDLFIPNYHTACKVWMNDGSGHFTNSGQNFGTTSGHGVALGDLDGDGDLDAFLVFLEGSGWVLLNNGAGQFTDTGQRLGGAGDNMGFVGLADLDGDDDLDAAVLRYNRPNEVWLNDGAGVFTAGVSLGDSTSEPMALGDLDSDLDIDIFMMNTGGSSVLLNDGAGNFTDTGQRLGYTDGWGNVEVGDLDGDGDLDAFVTNQIHGNTVWLNDGAGNFSAGVSYPGEGTEKLDLGDIEGDGDLDAFTTNYLLTNKVWLNDGAAGFTPIDSLFGTGAASITAGDMDSDGDLDVIVGRLDGYGPTSVYFNTTPSAGVGGGGIPPSRSLIWLNGSNPFDPAFEISYRVPAPGAVSLKLFDVLGREVQTLAVGAHPAGRYSVTLDGAELSSGVYFCRLEVRGGGDEEAVQTIKIMCAR